MTLAEPVAARRERRRWSPPIGLIALALLFVLSLPAVTPRFYASDEIEYFAYLRSLWFDRDLSFENEYQYFYDHGIARAFGFHQTFLELTSATGLRLNFGTIGCAILWAPMYGVADAGVRIARAMGSSMPADGFSRPYVSAVAYSSAVYGFLAILLSAVVARRLVGSGTWAAALVWAATPLPFYMYLAPGMAHACSAFVVAAFVAVWLTVRRHWSTRGLMALGALAALMTMVREQDVFFTVGVAVDFVWTLLDDFRAGRPQVVAVRIRGMLAGAATFLICMLPQLWAYRVLNGRLGPASEVSDKMQWWAPHALQVLLSPEHGFFIWTPLGLLCIAGLFLISRSSWRPPSRRRDPLARHAEARSAEAADGSQSIGDTRRIAICLIAMFAAQIYITGSVGTWTVAGSFGQRRFVGTTILLVIGLAALMASARGLRRTVLTMAIGLAVWWNLGLMAQFGAGLMDRQRLELGRNAYNTFVVVPRSLPTLAYRYFFDRASFYRRTND